MDRTGADKILDCKMIMGLLESLDNVVVVVCVDKTGAKKIV